MKILYYEPNRVCISTDELEYQLKDGPSAKPNSWDALGSRKPRNVQASHKILETNQDGERIH
jgi:hypothetical protein